MTPYVLFKVVIITVKSAISEPVQTITFKVWN